jgi:hypothetical protein
MDLTPYIAALIEARLEVQELMQDSRAAVTSIRVFGAPC